MMDTRRTILWVIFTMSLFFLWDNWQRYNGHASMFSSAPAVKAPASVSAPSSGTANDIPAATPTTTASPARAAIPASVDPAPVASERIQVRTDLLAVDLDTLGGELRRVELLKYQDTEDAKRNMTLLDLSPERTYLAQSGLVGGSSEAGALPNHKTIFTLLPGVRTLAEGQDQFEVSMQAETGGVRLIKTYTFKRGSYEIGVRHEVINTGTAPVVPQLYLQLVRDGNNPAGGSRFYSTFTGPAVYSEAGHFQKVGFSDIEKGKAPDEHVASASDGWVAMLQHYFVSAWLPAAGERSIYTEKVATNLYRVGVRQSLGSIAPGAAVKNDAELFVGPQVERLLEKTAPGLELVRDYGRTQLLAKPMFWLLEKLHVIIGNWGWAIVALTALIKAAFFPLSAASYKSMARMKNVAPRLKVIQEKYKDDRMKMNQAMMELYKTEKINPMGGCLPILIQIPVFIALYSTLLASVEMRGAPWMGWIHDLAAPDPFYILPVVMMVSMFVQFKLNPTPPDPMQAKMMMIMPLIFGVTFFFFPAGLVLYWVVNNILSIAQQWQITRLLGDKKAT